MNFQTTPSCRLTEDKTRLKLSFLAAAGTETVRRQMGLSQTFFFLNSPLLRKGVNYSSAESVTQMLASRIGRKVCAKINRETQ